MAFACRQCTTGGQQYHYLTSGWIAAELIARTDTLPGGICPPWFALGLALPSELRRMLRARGRDAYPEFVKLLPSPPPQVPIQRSSARRVGL